MAQRLYAEAYRPLRAEPTLEMLDRRAASLRAAEALDERAQSVLTWPLAEGAVPDRASNASRTPLRGR